MKLFIIGVMLIAFSPAALAGRAPVFDCNKFLAETEEKIDSERSPLEQTREKFEGTEPELESVLATVAVLLGDQRERFSRQIMKQLNGVKVIRETPKGVKKWLPEEKGVRFLRKPFEPGLLDDYTFFFEAIRTAFSNDIGDADQWINATAQERLRLALQFKSRATRVLLYEYLLYRAINDHTGEGAKPDLHAELDLKIPQRHPFHLFAPKGGRALFEEIRLTSELVHQIKRVRSKTEEAKLQAIENYVNQNFITLMHDYYSSKPGMVRFSSMSILVLIATGGVFAYLGDPTLPPPMDKSYEGLNPAIAQQRAVTITDPTEAMIKQLENTARERALSEEEQIVLEGLRGNWNEQP